MNNPQIDMARRLLAELAQMTEQASMTRSLRGGERAAAQSYNRALASLEGQGAVPDGMFEAIALDDADFGAIGVQARLLLSVIQEEPEARRKEGKDKHGDLGAVVALAPFLDSEDLGQMLRERIDDAMDVPDSLLTALAPFLDSHDLGDLVRRRTRPRAPQPPSHPPTPPVAPEPPSRAATPDLRPVSTVPTTLESLAERLRSPELTTEERQAIATRLAEFAYEQSVQG